MADFDWWSHAKLEALAKLLRTEKSPPASDTQFWTDAAKVCELGEDEEAAEELATDVANELEGWQESKTLASWGRPIGKCGITLGDLNLAESRLMLMVKGIKGIVYVASHQMDSLWSKDGIKYHCCIISPATTAEKTLAGQLPGVCQFLSNCTPALVCSSCPKLRMAVAAASLLHSGEASDVAEALDTLKARGILDDDSIGSSETDALEAFAETLQSGGGLSAKGRLQLQVETPKARDAKASSTGLTPKMKKLEAAAPEGLGPISAESPLSAKRKRDERISEEAF